MKQTRDIFIKEWEAVTENLAQYFSAKYFGNGAEMWWVAEDIGGVLFINDYFFDLNDIVDFIKYNYSKKKMFEYYDYALKRREENESPVNIKNYLAIKSIRKQLT